MSWTRVNKYCDDTWGFTLPASATQWGEAWSLVIAFPIVIVFMLILLPLLAVTIILGWLATLVILPVMQVWWLIRRWRRGQNVKKTV